jgi:uncharacterized membrane protein
LRAKLRQLIEYLNDSFWLRPALIVVCAGALAELLLSLDEEEVLAPRFVAAWLYGGGETGARTLLGAVAASMIGVVSTLFSITIATLTLASSQLGPRLLRNFTRDRGNQVTLGVYLGTFVYALLVLRSVHGVEEGAFVPHLAVTGALALALTCVSMLIFYVHHIATRINAETVIELVYQELRETVMRLTGERPPPERTNAARWNGAQPVTDERSGFIQQLDDDSIADWAAEHGVSIRLYARAGVFVFPGAPIAVVTPPHPDAAQAVRAAMALGAYPTPSMDIEYCVTQLTDIAIRALSSGINDPNTAIRVVDRLGAALCIIARRYLASGVFVRDGRVVFERDATSYGGLTDAMFHGIRQSAAHTPAVLIHLLEVLRKVAEVERSAPRLAELERHGTLVLADGIRTIRNVNDRETLAGRSAGLSNALAAAAREC